MSICPHCGEENAERARFCSTCGAAITPPGGRAEVRKTVTIVFCDVANSTRLGERLDPEAHRRVMGRYFEAMRAVLERHGGTVEKFIGDAVMAVFGIPVLHEDDALRAVRAAAEMRHALAELNHELRSGWDLEIAIRTGVNTGEVVTGEVGVAQTLVTGDAVVVAKRLEETAVANEIQLGADTYRLVADAVLAEPIGQVEAKGKSVLNAWRLLAVRPGAEVSPVRLDSPLVGRDMDLAALQEMFELVAAERSCRLFTVLGLAGIGKSRLAHELIAWIGDRALVLRGRCLPYGEGITFWPLVEMVKQAAGLTERDSPEEARHKIGLLLPRGDESALICERVAAAIGRGEGASTRPEETFWAVRRLLEALARERPLVVVIDDIQWAEGTFLDLVEYVAGWSTDAPIMVCCLARPELLESRPSWGQLSRNAVAVLLEPLREEQTDELIANLLGRLPLPRTTQSRIADAAEGNPLFVEELLRMLRDEGLLERANGGWRTAADLGELALPPTIHALLSARLDRLEPEERAVVQRASVAGQVFWWGAVAELSPPSVRGNVGACLQSLVRKELIRREPSGFTAEDAFRFGHILVRDAAYGSLPKEARADLHEGLADWLTRTAGDRSAEYEEIVAYHLEQAFQYRGELGHLDEHGRKLASRAAERLASAGRRALARGDVTAAVNLFSRAAAILADHDPARIAVLPELGGALRETGDLVNADRVLREALERTEGSSELATELSARIEFTALQLLSDPRGDQTDRLLEQVEEAMPALEELGEDRLLARAWTLIALARGIWKGRFATGEEALERALAHARAEGDRRQEAIILGQLAFSACWGPTPIPEAVERCERILESAGGDQLIAAGVRRYLASLQARQGRFEEARVLLDRAIEGYDQIGKRLTAEAARAFASGDVEILAGNYDAAERVLRPALEALDEMGERGYLSSVSAFLSAALYGQGRLDEAFATARAAEESAARDDIWSQVIARATRAKVLAQQGSCIEAEALAREAVALVAETDALELHGNALFDLGQVMRVCGSAAEARGYLVLALEKFEEKQCNVLAERTRSVLQSELGSAVRAGEVRADRER